MPQSKTNLEALLESAREPVKTPTAKVPLMSQPASPRMKASWLRKMLMLR